MSKTIAILGASGAVGTALAAQILRSRMLEPGDRLQLVGHGSRASEARLLGTRIDLLDAFDEQRIEIEVVPQLLDVDADIVVIASGIAASPQFSNRREMGVANRVIFEDIAEKCAMKVPDALFLVVSNPVELAVNVLCNWLDRKRVFGIGAQQDSLRFARAIARDLHMSRNDVRASVAGEHGQAMVPLWSSVELVSPNPFQLDALKRLKEESATIPLRMRVAVTQAKVQQLLRAARVSEAYEITRRTWPDVSIFIEPFITAHSMHSTPNATSNAVLQCIAAALADDRRRIHGQVRLQGEVLDIYGACGVPVTLARDGWSVESLDWLSPLEKEHLVESADSISDFIAMVLDSERPKTVVVAAPVQPAPVENCVPAARRRTARQSSPVTAPVVDLVTAKAWSNRKNRAVFGEYT
jgi:malate dehydrogenase